MSQVIHLAAGLRTACSSFRRSTGAVGFTLLEYHEVLEGKDDNFRACKTCHPHYVRRLNAVNKKRIQEGKAPKPVLPL